MAQIIPIYKNKKINPSGNEIADCGSGEIIDISGQTLTAGKKTNKVSVNYTNYLIIDIDKIQILVNKLRQVEIALLISILTYIQTETHICMDEDDSPMTAKKAGRLIGESEQSTKIKLNALVNLNLLYYGKLHYRKSLGKVYVVNPHLLKKGKTFDKRLMSYFDDIF